MMDLVDHDKLEVLEQFYPDRVVREDAHVKHIRVGDQDMGQIGTNLLPLPGRGVTIIEGGQRHLRHHLLHGQNIFKPVQNTELVLGQGL